MMPLLIMTAVLSMQMDIFDPAAGAFLDETPDAEEYFARADSFYREGDYLMSAELYLRGLRAQPWNSGSIYNLACCYGLLGEEELAAAYLKRAWRAGFDDIGHVRWDPDFQPVRESEVFSYTVDSLEAAALMREERLGEEIIFYAEGPFRCRVKLPDGYDGSRPVPLLLGLHGLGGSPELFIGLWEVAEDFGCILAVPQAPSPYLVGSRIGYSWFTGDDEESRSVSALRSRDFVLALLDRLEESYSISEVYLFGYSQGGGMTYLTGLHAPERFAALAPFSGWLDVSLLTEEEIRSASGVPVRIVHGEQDRVVDYQSALFADSLLSAEGYDVELMDFQGQHVFSREALAEFLEEFLY